MPRSEVKRQTSLHTVKPSSSLVPTPMIQPPTFGQTIKEGIGFGAGSAIGHRIIGAVLGPTTASTATTPTTEFKQTSQQKCVSERNTFELCLKTKSADDGCNNEFNAYTQCIQLN